MRLIVKMAVSTRAAFDDFYQIIKPTQAQMQDVSNKRLSTHNFLSQSFGSDSDMPLLRTTLIGSAERHTHIRPVDDVDVMAVFSDENDVYENTYASDSQAFLGRIRRALGQESTTTIGTRGQAVRLFYKNGAHVDIAPVFSSTNGGYLLPSGDGGWIKTDPDKQSAWFSSENIRLTGDNLRPTVRLLKRWNNVHSKHFKSYHLEVVIANTFKTLGSNWRINLARFFEWAPQHIDAYDPAGYGGNLSSYLTFNERQALLSRLNTAADRAAVALEAENNGNHEEAIRLWRIELGSEFPTYS